MSDEFKNTKDDWESHDEWQFADRDAERRFFFTAGQTASAARIAELEAWIEERAVAANLLHIRNRDRIAELEADCKVMAGHIGHLSRTIAAKYREGK